MKCNSDVLAKLMQCTAERLSNEGLIRLNLYKFPRMCTLSPTVLEKFSAKSANLKELTIGGMRSMENEPRRAVVMMTT